jgi:hypothetical protein
MKNTRPKSIEREDCAFLLGRSRKIIDQEKRNFYWVTAIGIIIALVSVSMNLGVVEITKIKYGEIEVVVKHLFFVRLFLTCASIASLAALLYVRLSISQAEKIIDYLAESHNYKKALIVLDFENWFKKTKDSKLKGLLNAFLALITCCLLAVLPLFTFILTMLRS